MKCSRCGHFMFRATVTVTRECESFTGVKWVETLVYGPDCAALLGLSPKVQQRAKTQPRPVKRACKKVSGGIRKQIQAGQIQLFEELTA